MSKTNNHEYSQKELDNHANQLNPTSDPYWTSRGYDERPGDWESELLSESRQDKNSLDRS